MRAESNLKPDMLFEIEALPAKEGAACTVIFYDNITGPLQRENQEGEVTEYYKYDRYELETTYRDSLQESIEKNTQAWLEAAKKAEGQNDSLTELERLQSLVASQQETINTMNSAIDDLIVFSLGGEE